MKPVLQWLVAIFLVSAPLLSHAGIRDWIMHQLGKPPVDYGYWKCGNCYLPPLGTPPEQTGSLADVHTFVKYNNGEIHDSKKE
jgi:hypothetical protein